MTLILPCDESLHRTRGETYLLVGSLAHSGRWRAVLAPSMDQPHLVDGLDRITRALGGVTNVWRFDRMATVCHPDTGRVTASFAGVAKHYGVQVAICPPRAGHRKGVVEKINHTAAQRWWRTLPDDVTVEAAQASVEAFASTRGDTRLRPGSADGAGVKATVATLASAEPLRAAPVAAYPVVLVETRVVSRQALVSFRGNRYSIGPELAGATVEVHRRLGADTIDIVAAGVSGAAAGRGPVVMARHRLVADGTGATVRDTGHVIALEAAAMTAAATATGAGRPHRRKERIPPDAAALAAAAELRAARPGGTGKPIANNDIPAAVATEHDTKVIDLATYERAAHGRNTLT